MKKYLSRFSDNQRTVISVIFIIIVMATFVFTGVWLVAGPYWIKAYNLGDKGTLGDAVNGLSAPFISFFAAILVYITFREQNKANKLLQSQWQLDTFLKVFNDMNDKLQRMTVVGQDGSYEEGGSLITREYRGVEVANYILATHSANDKEAPSELMEFIYIVDELAFLCELINESPENRREFMIQKVKRFYFSGFHKAIFQMKKYLPRDRGPYKSFWNSTERLKKQLERFITVGDLLTANGEGEEHESLMNAWKK
jgi:hypothetical protein